MLELVTLPPAFGMRNVSPFCLKIEMLLTHLKLPFTQSELADPRKAPKGKLPYLVADGKTIADSELITEHLDATADGRVYAGLTPAQRGQGVALARLAEDHLYWIMVASRGLDPAWFPNIVEGFFGIAPRPVRPLVAGLARRQVERTYWLHGLGRHTLEEQTGFARRDLAALEAVAALMAGLLDNRPATWLSELAEPYAALRAYTDRVQATVGVYGREQP